MIQSFEIQNFKCLKHLALDDLARVTILGGQNNSGKSSVLEAMFMFLDRGNPNMLLRQYAGRGIPNLPLTPEAVLQPIYTDYDHDAVITFTAGIGHTKQTMSIRYNANYQAPSVPAHTVALSSDKPSVVRTDEEASPRAALDITYAEEGKADETGHLYIQRDLMGYFVDYMESGPQPAAILGARLRAEPNTLASRFGGLDLIGKQDEVIRFLQIIEPRLKSLSTISIGSVPIIHGDIGLRQKIPIAYAGDGMSRLLELVLFIATNQGGVLLVDEIENGIHYSVMPKVWRAIGEAARRFDCQIVATTHSYECLQAAYEGMGEDLAGDLRYIRLDRRDNEITARTYNYELLGTALAAGLEVR